MSDLPALNEDFSDLLRALTEAGVDFLVVGAHALAHHGVVRATGDLDVLVRPSSANALRVIDGLKRFGAPVAAHRITSDDLAVPDTVYQIGLPPRRIDILTSISGLDYDDAAREARRVTVGPSTFWIPGREAMIANKRASGRPKDLEDLRNLERAGPPTDL